MLLPTDPSPRSSSSLQKRAGYQETTTKQDKTEFNKARQKQNKTTPHIKAGQPNRRKRVLRTGKRVKDSTCFHCLGVPKTQYGNSHNIYAEDVMETHTGPGLMLQSLVKPSSFCFSIGKCVCWVGAALSVFALVFLYLCSCQLQLRGQGQEGSRGVSCM